MENDITERAAAPLQRRLAEARQRKGREIAAAAVKAREEATGREARLRGGKTEGR